MHVKLRMVLSSLATYYHICNGFKGVHVKISNCEKNRNIKNTDLAISLTDKSSNILKYKATVGWIVKKWIFSKSLN